MGMWVLKSIIIIVILSDLLFSAFTKMLAEYVRDECDDVTDESFYEEIGRKVVHWNRAGTTSSSPRLEIKCDDGSVRKCFLQFEQPNTIRQQLEICLRTQVNSPTNYNFDCSKKLFHFTKLDNKSR